jgi:hypothetical protein
MNTSVEDCRSSVVHIVDQELLERVLAECRAASGHKSREKVISARLRQLRKKA